MLRLVKLSIREVISNRFKKTNRILKLFKPLFSRNEI